MKDTEQWGMWYESRRLTGKAEKRHRDNSEGSRGRMDKSQIMALKEMPS